MAARSVNNDTTHPSHFTIESEMIAEVQPALPDTSARVLILYNDPVLSLTHPDADSEHEILYTVDEVEKTLVKTGYDVSRLAVGRDPEVLLSGLSRHRPDLVFN